MRLAASTHNFPTLIKMFQLTQLFSNSESTQNIYTKLSPLSVLSSSYNFHAVTDMKEPSQRPSKQLHLVPCILWNSGENVYMRVMTVVAMEMPQTSFYTSC